MPTHAQRTPLQQTLAAVRKEVHSRCVVCGAWNTRGLRLDFGVMSDGSVQADFDCADLLEGYPHTLHGGIIASLLDGAMTNCLFAHGLVAVTAELTIRFLRPVVTNQAATVRARLQGSRRTLHRLGAELRQNGQLMATATGKFMNGRHASPAAPTR